MAHGDRLRLTEAGIRELTNELGKCLPERIDSPAEPSVADVGGKAVFDALVPVVYLAQITVDGAEEAVEDFIKKIKEGDTRMCVTDQALGPANSPTEPIV
jgi:hypothetical protein